MRGWLAVCQDCPITLGGYGELIQVHAEFPVDDKAAADQWADLHAGNHCHQVDVRPFERFTAELQYVNEPLMQQLFGDKE